MNFKPTLFCLLAICCAYQANGQLFPGLPGIKDIFGQISDRISGAIGQFDNQLGNLIGDVQNFTRSLADVAHCYESELKGSQINIFDGSLSFKSIISQYYGAFPNNTICPESIANLFNSTKDIITRCLKPAGNSTAKFGFTPLSDKSRDQIRQLLGVQIPTEPQRAKRLSGGDAQCQVNTGTALPASFDWRTKNAVTSVKDQQQCGSCFTFATAGAIESALVIAGKASLSVDLSEQELVNCARSDGHGCDGGNSQLTFSYVKANGIGKESADPYVAQEQTCTAVPAAATISDYCIRSKYRYTYSSVAEQLTDDTMKRALVQRGPLYISVDAGTDGWQNYRGGVLDTTGCSTTVNHAVLLVGYDSSDNTWIIKNSWSAYWGMQGFLKLPSGQNTCGVQTEIAWPLL